MKRASFHHVSAVALSTACLLLVLITNCFAAGNAEQVNLHVGQSADTVYLTYTSSEDSEAPAVVTGPEGTASYKVHSLWSKTAGKYIQTAEITGLRPGTEYRYSLEDGAYTNRFTTAKASGAFTFAFLADPQIAHTAESRSAAAVFDELNERDGLAFVYTAGDLTDTARSEHQWELFFESEGDHAGAGQRLLGSHLLAAAQGNHDNDTFGRHITAPSAGEDLGRVVYSFDYSNVKFIVLNLNNWDTWSAQADFLRKEVAEAKNAGQWVIVGFHQSLYTGASHVVDSSLVSARKFWSPLLAELGVDVVLQGHDHVYARGFVTAQGRSADLTVKRNAYPAGSGAPLYLTGGESGARKWYNAVAYSVQEDDPLVPNYGFLEINSAVPGQNPWGTNTSETQEQTYTLISVNGDEMRFQTYMLRYDGERDEMVTEPYLYDSLILRQGAALRRDEDALAKLPAASFDAELAQVPMTRQMVVMELYRLAGSPSGESASAFSDVPSGTELARAVSWAVRAGVVSGYSDGTFRPDQTVTRAQFAAFSYRYAKAVGSVSSSGRGVGTYRDWREVPAWAEPSLSWAAYTGLLQGRRGNQLAPNAEINRAEGNICVQRLRALVEN